MRRDISEFLDPDYRPGGGKDSYVSVINDFEKLVNALYNPCASMTTREKLVYGDVTILENEDEVERLTAKLTQISRAQLSSNKELNHNGLVLVFDNSQNVDQLKALGQDRGSLDFCFIIDIFGNQHLFVHSGQIPFFEIYILPVIKKDKIKVLGFEKGSQFLKQQIQDRHSNYNPMRSIFFHSCYSGNIPESKHGDFIIHPDSNLDPGDVLEAQFAKTKDKTFVVLTGVRI